MGRVTKKSSKMEKNAASKARNKAEKARDRLLREARTLGIFALVSEAGEITPHSSHVAPGQSPFILMDGSFYCFASELAAHIRVLCAGGDARFQVIEDETVAQNIWARVRLTFSADVREVKRNEERFDMICDKIGEKHGPVMAIIKPFTDFHLFEITPTRGVLVTGFASAYNVTGCGFDLAELLSSS